MAAPDLSEFIGLSRPKKPPCKVGLALAALTDPEREQLHAACAADKGVITVGAIRDWLAKRGHQASVSGVTNHRAGHCTCHERA